MGAPGAAKTGGRKPGSRNKPAAPVVSAAVTKLASTGATKFPAYKLVRTDELVAYANNARTHSPAQIAKIVASVREFGFTNPVLTDGKRGIIAGHGRVLAAEVLGMDVLPTIELRHLSAAQRRAYILTDNRLALDAGWNTELLELELGELKDIGFPLELTGFELPEIGRLLGDPEPAPSQPAPPPTHCASCGRPFAAIAAARATADPGNVRLGAFAPALAPR